MNIDNPEFWLFLDRLIDECPIVIDRPKGSVHPRYPKMIYPVNYGYLKGSTTVDGGGLDCWRGSGKDPLLVGLLLTVDVIKKDAEIKLLLGCTEEEIQLIINFLNGNSMRAVKIARNF